MVLGSFPMSKDMIQQLYDTSAADVPEVEAKCTWELEEKYKSEPEHKLFAKAHHVSPVEQQTIYTPKGQEPVLQQSYTEKRIERDQTIGKTIKNLAVTEIDEASGKGTRITISEQEIDSKRGLTSEGKDFLTVKETISVTPSYTSSARDIIRERIKPKIDVNLGEVAQLIQEETEDVENTLRMVPPDLELREEKYSLKKRLQNLRLNSESIALLEKTVINPKLTADDAMPETPPEALAKIMYNVERIKCAPHQLFHTLFQDRSAERNVILSSIGSEPLQDVVIPQQFTADVHKESVTTDLSKLTEISRNVADADEWPLTDIFTNVMSDEQKEVNKDIVQKRTFQSTGAEIVWDEDFEAVINIVGAEPQSVLQPTNTVESSNLEEEMIKGMEYYVNADPVQYMSRVQLRGSHKPAWFPGYMYALPNFPDVMKLARDPNEVFAASWKACQPKNITDDSVKILP